MITIYRSAEGGLKTVELPTKECWIDVTNPTQDEARNLPRYLSIPSEFVAYSLNPDKIPLVEKADGAEDRAGAFSGGKQRGRPAYYARRGAGAGRSGGFNAGGTGHDRGAGDGHAHRGDRRAVRCAHTYRRPSHNGLPFRLTSPPRLNVHRLPVFNLRDKSRRRGNDDARLGARADKTMKERMEEWRQTIRRGQAGIAPARLTLTAQGRNLLRRLRQTRHGTDESDVDNCISAMGLGRLRRDGAGVAAD